MFRYWLLLGVKMGWISKPYCMTHDGNYEYMTEEEREEWDEGNDPCHTLSLCYNNLALLSRPHRYLFPVGFTSF